MGIINTDELDEETKKRITDINLEAEKNYDEAEQKQKKFYRTIIPIIAILLVCILLTAVYGIQNAREGELIGIEFYSILIVAAIMLVIIEEWYRWYKNKVHIDALDDSIQEILKYQKRTGKKLKYKIPLKYYFLFVFGIAILCLLIVSSIQKYLSGNPNDLYAIGLGGVMFVLLFGYFYYKYKKTQN